MERKRRQNEAKRWLVRLLVGLLIGAGGVAPGVSGGALAVMLGVYDRLAHLAAHPKEAARQWRFCLPVGAGIALGFLTLGRALSAFFVAAPTAARCLFIGLMAGTLPSVWKTASRDGFRPRYLFYAALGAVFGGLLLFGFGLPSLTQPTFPALLLCGVVLGVGTAIPGISSSFILLSMDAYGFVLLALGGQRPDFLPPLLMGFAVSLVLTVKLADTLYRRFFGAFSFAVFGFLLASFVPVCPALTPDASGALAGTLGVLSAALSLCLSSRLVKNSCVDKPGQNCYTSCSQKFTEKEENSHETYSDDRDP